MEISGTTRAMMMTEDEMETRFRRADFSSENPGLFERLRDKIQKRISAPKRWRAMMRTGAALSLEEMDLATAAKGSPGSPGGTFHGLWLLRDPKGKMKGFMMKNLLSQTNVLLVTMPFCDEYMPCLTLALFKSILARAGIRSRVQHEFLYFASRIGVRKYQDILRVCTFGHGHDYFACETIFADAAHEGGPLRSFDEYIRWMEETHLPGKAFAGHQRQTTLATLDLFREARGMAEVYLDEVVARVRESGAKIVAFLSMYQQHNAMIALAKRLKREAKPPILMAGGANCEGDAGAALAAHFPVFDYVFTGDADEILAPICARLLREGWIPDAELPDGVATPTRPGTSPAKITTDMDALPLPDFSDYFREG